MNYTHCPLCKSELQIYDQIGEYVQCISCMTDGMPRFKSKFFKGHPNFMLVWIDQYYIEFYYENNQTVVTHIDVCMRKDAVVLKRLLNFDPENPDKLKKRLDVLMYLS